MTLTKQRILYIFIERIKHTPPFLKFYEITFCSISIQNLHSILLV